MDLSPENFVTPEIESKILAYQSGENTKLLKEIAAKPGAVKENGELTTDAINEFMQQKPTKDEAIRDFTSREGFVNQILAEKYGRGSAVPAPYQEGEEFYKGGDIPIFELGASMLSKGAEDIVQLGAGAVNVAGFGMKHLAALPLNNAGMFMPDELERLKTDFGFTPDTPTADMIGELVKDKVRSTKFGQMLTNEQGYVDVGRQLGEARKGIMGGGIEDLSAEVGPVGTAMTVPLYLLPGFGVGATKGIGKLFTGQAFEGPIARMLTGGKEVAPMLRPGIAAGAVGGGNVVANMPFAIENARDPNSGDVNMGQVALESGVAGLIGAVLGGAISLRQIYKESPGKFGQVLDTIISHKKKEIANVDSVINANRQQINQGLEEMVQGEAEQATRSAAQQFQVPEPQTEVGKVIAHETDIPEVQTAVPEVEKSLDTLSELENQTASKFGNKNSLQTGIDDLAQPTVSAMGDVSPRMASDFGDYEYYKHTVAVPFNEPIHDYVKLKNKVFSKADKKLWDLALRNGDIDAQQQLMTKYAKKPGGDLLPEAFEKAKQAKDDMLAMYEKETGRSVDRLENHWPSRMTKYEKYLKDHGREAKTRFNKAVAEFIKREGREPTALDKQSIAANVFGTKSVGKSKFAKHRSRAQIEEKDLKYYASSDDAIFDYTSDLSHKIAETRLLGKPRPVQAKYGKADVANKVKEMKDMGVEVTPEQATAMLEKELSKQPVNLHEEYIAKLIRRGELDPHNKARALDLMDSTLNRSRQSAHGVLQGVKDSQTLAFLTNAYAAMLQLGDLAATASQHGPMHTIKGFTQTVLGGSDVTLHQLGIDDTAFAEMFTGNHRKKFLNQLMKKSFFKPIDNLTKQTTVNAALSKFKTMAKKIDIDQLKPSKIDDYIENLGDKKLKDFLTEQRFVYGKEFPELMQDLANGKVTDNVRKMTFEDLGKIQPIRIIDMPPAYLKHPNGRFLYALKSFTLKRMDMWRNDVLREITQGDKVKGMKNLVNYSAYLVGGEAATRYARDKTVEAVREKMFGEDLEEDKSLLEFGAETALSQFFLSRYVLDKAVTRGDVPGALGSIVFPGFPYLTDAALDIKDIVTEDEDIDMSNLRSYKYIPLAGKPYDLTGGRTGQKKRGDI